MAFKFKKKPKQIWWPVKVREPHESKPGQFTESAFKGEFVFMNSDEYEERRREAGDNSLALLRAIMTDWDLKADDDQPVNFQNDDEVKAVLSYKHISIAIFSAYNDFITGGVFSKN